MSAINGRENSPKRSPVTILVLVLLFLVGLILVVVSEAYITVELWKRVLSVLGVFIAVSVGVSFLYRVTLRARDDAARKDELRDILDHKVEEMVENRFVYGLAGFQQKMDFVQLFDDLKKGDELWWLDTYAPGHKLWIEHMRDAIGRGAKIRILALNPECANADYRAEEIGDLYSPVHFKSELQSFIDDLSVCAQDESRQGGSLEVRKYSDLPCIPIYLVCHDNKPIYAYTSFFMCSPTGVAFPHMRWRPSELGLLSHCFNYINRKWNKNGPKVVPP